MAIRLEEFEAIGETTADSKERVTLARALRQLRLRFGDRPFRFNILYNETTGMIVLAPATTVPLREAWLYENPKALKMVLKGIEQAGRGERSKRKSPARHAGDDTE